MATTLDLDHLAAETIWLRRLARALVADTAAADDVVQDTYLIAQTEAPRDGRPLRPWMVRVLWNRIRMRTRSAQRSARRDEAFAKLAEAPATPEAIVDRLVMQRMLTGFVLALEPLYRDVVVLHYFEGLTSTEIGNRLGIAAGSVRWRLKQAIDQLRQRLDEREPNRAWVAGLTGFAHGGDAIPLAAGKLFVAAIVGAIALAVLAIVVPRGSSAPPPRPEARATPPRLPSAMPAVAAHVPTAGAESTALDPRHLVGIVIDRDDQPAAGADVTLDCGYLDDPAPSVMRTGPDGRFAFDADPACQPTIWALRGDTAGLAHEPRHEAGPLRVRLVEQAHARLHVVDAETGRPVAGAAIATHGVEAGREQMIADGNGDARLRWLGWVTYVQIHAPGYVAIDDVLEGHKVNGVLMVEHVKPGTELEHTYRLVRGVPLGGTAAPGTTISIKAADGDYSDRAEADAAGRFQLAVPHPGAYRISTRATSAAAADGEPEEIISVPAGGRSDVVVQAAPRREIHGTVLDAAGAAVAGATVAPSQGGRRPVTTDALGRFAIKHGPGPLELVARRGDLASAIVHVEPDTNDVTLVIGRAGIGGVVVDANGEPVAHANVWLNYCCEQAVVISGRGRTADEHGRFAFEEVPTGEFVLSVRGPDDEEYDEANDVHVSSGNRDLRLVVR